MPNHVTNKLIFSGTPEEIDNIVHECGYSVPPRIELAHDNSFIFINNLLGYSERSVVWFNLETKKYERRTKYGMESLDDLPSGFMPKVENECIRFPDFDKIIPQPYMVRQSLKANESGLDSSIDIAKLATQDKELWYNWRLENWGTKWNSYECKQLQDNMFLFDTAWSAPHPIILALSKKFPFITIHHLWADEDRGHNAGEAMYKGAMTVYIENYESNSDKALDLHDELRGYDDDDDEE